MIRVFRSIFHDWKKNTDLQSVIQMHEIYFKWVQRWIYWNLWRPGSIRSWTVLDLVWKFFWWMKTQQPQSVYHVLKVGSWKRRCFYLKYYMIGKIYYEMPKTDDYSLLDLDIVDFTPRFWSTFCSLWYIMIIISAIKANFSFLKIFRQITFWYYSDLYITHKVSRVSCSLWFLNLITIFLVNYPFHLYTIL